MTNRVHTDETVAAKIEALVGQIDALLGLLADNAAHAEAHNCRAIARSDRRRIAFVNKARAALNNAKPD